MRRHLDDVLRPDSAAVTAVPIDRRGFLRSASGGTVAIAVASMLPAGCSADYPQAGEDDATLVSLSAKEYAVAKAAAEALLVGVPVSAAAIAQGIDAELAAVGDPIESDLRNVLRLLEHLTILGFHRRTFTELRPEERLRYLNGWATSRLDLRRGAFQAVRSFVQYFAYIQPETRALTGFEGPLPEHVSVPVVRIVDYGDVA
jgi:hypothetical protein